MAKPVVSAALRSPRVPPSLELFMAAAAKARAEAKAAKPAKRGNAPAAPPNG